MLHGPEMVVAGAGPLLHYRGHAEMNEEVREAILDWLSGPPVADPLDPEFRTSLRSPNASVVMLSEGEADWKKEYNARMMSLVTQCLR